MRLSTSVRRLTVALLAVSAIVAGAAATTPAAAQQFDGFLAAGDLLEARSAHTATLLLDGDVLIVGGNPQSWRAATPALVTAELFDTASGRFTSTGELMYGRSSHTATLLLDGQVLIAGGVLVNPDKETFLRDQAELYDPETGQFTSAGTMVATYGWHTATLLPSGEVLLVSLLSAELYDPVLRRFTQVGDLSTARTKHTATLLQDGRVLIAGGSAVDGPTSTAEIYDPATATFQVTGSMADGRIEHSATLLPDGRVLVVAGGEEGTAAATSAELYDPATGTFSATDSVPRGPDSSGAEGRWTRRAVLLPGGNVLAVGGPYAASISAIYDPIAGTFTATGDGPAGGQRSQFSTTLLNDGRVLIAGGEDTGWPALSLAEIYDPGPANVAAVPPAGGLTFGVAGTTSIQALINAQAFDVGSVWKLDIATQSWLSYVPGGLAIANSLKSISAADVVTLKSK